MQTSFQNKKELMFIITLGSGSVGPGGSNQVTIQGFRAVADIEKGGGMMFTTLRAKIFGVTQDDMNSITTLQWDPKYRLSKTVEV